MRGSAPQTAALISALFPLGGVGAILFGWLMDRFNANMIIAVGFALTAVAVYAIGQVAGTLALLVLVVFAAGTLMNTSSRRCRRWRPASIRRRGARPAWRGCWASAASVALPAPSSWPSSRAGN